ncbi:autophagy-related protein 101 [Diaphorina citri]|uniref:Autophagy-related protein 101 n=1 Tax=Diaphorina citri TaxID=121845 RepID=A0A3Q0IU97_DIACI|nr:autophagy-related protein 101 [Diaphorina citri]
MERLKFRTPEKAADRFTFLKQLVNEYQTTKSQGIRCSSADLNQTVRKHVNQFSNILRNTQDSNVSPNPTSGQISLEFFKKNKKHWPFNEICIPWELWNVRLELIKLNNEQERRLSCEKIVNVLTQQVIYICDVMNRNDYVPNIPIKSELDLIFDTSYRDIQPYLFKIHFLNSSQYNLVDEACPGVSNPAGHTASSSVAHFVKKTIKDTLLF